MGDYRPVTGLNPGVGCAPFRYIYHKPCFILPYLGKAGVA